MIMLVIEPQIIMNAAKKKQKKTCYTLNGLAGHSPLESIII